MAWAPGLFARLAQPGDRELGELGERLAARELTRRGWRVLGRRVRTPAGEVDLVARRGAELLALEVKTSRASGPRRFRPADRFRSGAQRRQRRALDWIAARLEHRGARSLALCEVYAGPGARPRLHFERLPRPPPESSRFHPERPRGR